MKFFINLPKTSFASSIGNFEISNFFTYLDVENLKFSKASVNIDNKTTLIEAAYSIYGDPNNFWTFIAANNTVNPFDLLEENVTNFLNIQENKVSFLLFPGATAVTGGVAFPAGSLIFPYIGNTGACYFYGYTGNYDLYGRYAIIESSSFYDGYMTIGRQHGGTGDFIVVGASAERVSVVKYNAGGTYEWAGNYYANNKKYAKDKITSIVNPKDAKIIYREAVSSNETIDDILPESTPISGVTFAVTSQEANENISKNIKAYSPNELGTVQSLFITAKY
jgi:hypothetical protein